MTDHRSSTDPRYPIGPFDPASISIPREERINDIRTFPVQVKDFLDNLPEDGLNYTYRPDGWTVRQVVHHCADSHMNALIRFKLALTEDRPQILPYKQPEWAQLPDTRLADISASVLLLRGLHDRWTVLLENMSDADYQRVFIHPEHPLRIFSLDLALAQYSWHSRHHLAHLKLALERNN